MNAYRTPSIRSLAFRDFAPRRLEQRVFGEDEYEDFGAAVAGAAHWIRTEQPSVVNVETVVLPNVWESGQRGSGDANLPSSGDLKSTWHQIVRVWYWHEAAR